MREQINIIQFMPYFPPHKGGLETVGEEIVFFWVEKNLGRFINVVTSFEQEEKTSPQPSPQGEGVEHIIFEGSIIGYKKDNYEVLVVPSFEIITNFPVYKIWSKEYKLILKYLKEKTSPQPSPQGEGVEQNWKVFTHTRFFLTTLIGGLFARKNNIKWIHIEHGSSYVKLSSKMKSYLSIIYDKIIGKWIFKKADNIIAISNGVKTFIQKEFIDRDIEIVYNGINFKSGEKIDNGDLIKIGFVGRLVKLKGVDLLLKSFENLSKKYPNIELDIVGDGEEKEKLGKYIYKNNLKNINLLGLKNREFIANIFLPSIDILVNPSFQEGLPTTVLEGLLSKCIVVATDVGGTKEISNNDDLIIINKGSILELEIGIEKAILNYKNNIGKSYDSVKNNFDWNSIIFKYYDICEK